MDEVSHKDCTSYCVIPFTCSAHSKQFVGCWGWGLGESVEKLGFEVIQCSEVGEDGFTILSILKTTELYILKG